MQQEIDFNAARAVGATAGQACADAAQRKTAFDLEAAREYLVRWLTMSGPTDGEMLVMILRSAGFRPHDDRAFGPVFSVLARRGVIKCVGHCARKRGHGTAGGRIWEAVR